MAKLPIKGASLALIVEAALAARHRWDALPSKERTELARLLRTSKGRPANLTADERAELRRLVGRLNLPGLGRSLVPLATRHSRRRRP